MVLPRQLKIHKFSTDQKKRNKRLSAIGYNLHTNSCSAYGFVLLLGVRSKNKRFCPFFQKVLQKRDLTPLVFARAILAMPGDPFFLNRYLHATAIKKGTLLVCCCLLQQLVLGFILFSSSCSYTHWIWKSVQKNKKVILLFEPSSVVFEGKQLFFLFKTGVLKTLSTWPTQNIS